MRITTERLTLRHIAAEDWPAMQAIWEDFSASPYAQYDMPHETASGAVQSRIARWADACAGGRHVFFAACLDELPIGYVSFNRRERGYEIGYGFHSRCHGRGYAKESLRALIRLFAESGETHFSAGTALNNHPSVALLKSLGFVQTGYERVSFYRDELGNPIFFDGGVFELDVTDEGEKEV